ncbi:MAG: endonuclease/exonuclease/phosphatase, partial [Bacteroidetes bacterium]|nr:endonuclease/exonuclease/phosphatase [Bacteroidota bacterium]
MNRLILCLISLFFIHLSASAQTKQYKVGVVGFYNCENFYDTIDDPKTNDEDFLPGGAYRYGTAIYTDKVGRLTEVLSQIGKDISPDGLSMFGVAEIENEKVLTDVISQPAFKGRNYKIVHYESPDARGVDVALIYNPKYFRVLSSEPLNVALIEEGVPHATRDVLWVNGVYDGDTVNVFVNHWPSRRGGDEASAPYRATAAGVAKRVIDSLMKINPDTKVILMGDLNDDPTSPSVAKVIGAKGDKEKVKKGEMYNPWVKFIKNGIGTLAYNDAWNLFDQIIVSYGYLNQEQNGYFYSKAMIFKKDFMIQQTGNYKGYPLRTFDGNNYQHGYSDHLP